MNISFKTHFPWNGPDGLPEPTNFPANIVKCFDQQDEDGNAHGGGKLHTIRRINRAPRYKEGQDLKMCTGSRFTPVPFAEVSCFSTQVIEIHPTVKFGTIMIEVWVREPGVLRKPMNTEQLCALAENDGLTLEQFTKWFVLDTITNGPGHFQVVHWTTLRY